MWRGLLAPPSDPLLGRFSSSSYVSSTHEYLNSQYIVSDCILFCIAFIKLDELAQFN